MDEFYQSDLNVNSGTPLPPIQFTLPLAAYSVGTLL